MKLAKETRPIPDCVCTLPIVRWVQRLESAPHLPEGVAEPVMVLQQKLFDGNDDAFWADVQIEQPE